MKCSESARLRGSVAACCELSVGTFTALLVLRQAREQGCMTSDGCSIRAELVLWHFETASSDDDALVWVLRRQFKLCVVTAAPTTDKAAVALSG